MTGPERVRGRARPPKLRLAREGYNSAFSLLPRGCLVLFTARRMADRALTYAESTADAFRRATLLDEVHSRLDEGAADRAEAVGTRPSA